MAATTNGGTTERVWDRFLSEQDKASLGGRPARRRGFGERPALLLIDLYRWVYGDEPEPLLESMKKWPGSCGLPAWEAIPPTQKLLAAARSAGIPVIYSTGAGDSVVPQWAGGSADRANMLNDPEMADRYRRRDEIIDEVAPQPGELVIYKQSPSVFWGTPLIGYLVSQGIDTIIVGGESTSGCVRSTVTDGCTNRFRMMVVEQCVFDRHESAHAIELFTMDRKYADVVQLDEALQYLDQWQETHARRG